MKLNSIIYTILFLCITQFAFSIPADPDMTQTILSGGKEILIRQWGDEFAHGFETLDGYTIVSIGKMDEWSYAIHDDDGRLIPSLFVVGIDEPSLFKIEKHLRPKTDNNRKLRNSMLEKKAQSLKENEVRYEGDWHVLTIFIDFPDQPHIYSTEEFQQLLFSFDPVNPRSMADYYKEVSYGKFHIIGDAIGWYTAKNEKAYYGENTVNNFDDFDKVRELVIEAVTAADPYIDFSLYDNDKDGEVDAVNIYHSGRGEESGGVENDIWAHMNLISSSQTTADGCTISTYTIQPELYYDDITSIGILCHEFGHALGLPDLYDSDQSSSGIGSFGLMGYGGSNTYFGKKMDCPAHFCPWSKEFLGWTDISLITSTDKFMLMPAEEDSLVYKIKGELPDDGYFLIENRQKMGFDRGLPGENGGVLIWHIGGCYFTST
jgi:immune inhibitor A